MTRLGFVCVLVAAVACCVLVSADPNPKNFTGYIVTGQWDGRTIPDVRWALDVTRQDTEWRFRQELKLQQLIPTTEGPAPAPSYTAYDPVSRVYFMATATRNSKSSASIWALAIAPDCNSSKSLGPEQRWQFPSSESNFVGLQVLNNGGVLTVLAFFDNGTVLTVDYKTGNTAFWANIANNTRIVTTAIEKNQATGEIYVITQAFEGTVSREVVTINTVSKQVTSVPLPALKNHDPEQETPFELLWMPTLSRLMVFYTGLFDQLVYLEPASGALVFAIFNLAEFGRDGHFEFTANDFLEDDDLWTDAAIDLVENKMYFQCSDTDPDSGFVTTTLCEIPVPAKIETLAFVNVAIEPMTYGYVGMQYVQVVS